MQFILYWEFLLLGHFLVLDNRFYLENLSKFLTYGKYENVSLALSVLRQFCHKY